MGYTRDELIQIGERFEADALNEWAGQIAQAARQDLARLKSRGIVEKTLQDIDAARDEVKKLNFMRQRETKEPSPFTVARWEAFKAAFEWREEARGIAEAVFDSEPDTLHRFRTGVKTSRSLPKLITEIGLLLAMVRDHRGSLKGVGVGDEFVNRGEKVLRGLMEAQQRQAEESAETPKAIADLHHAQGVLYTRARFVRRVAQVEFRGDEDKLARYSYEPLRRAEAGARRQARPVPAQRAR
jgi:hypothetical protein